MRCCGSVNVQNPECDQDRSQLLVASSSQRPCVENWRILKIFKMKTLSRSVYNFLIYPVDTQTYPPTLITAWPPHRRCEEVKFCIITAPTEMAVPAGVRFVPYWMLPSAWCCDTSSWCLLPSCWHSRAATWATPTNTHARRSLLSLHFAATSSSSSSSQAARGVAV